MSANIVWFPFYIGDYLKDTQHLSVIEHGMYFKLMLSIYSTGKPIPHKRRYAIADATALPTDMLGSTPAYEMVDEILEDYFIKDGDYWTHKRITVELDKQKDFSKKQSDRAKKRWDKKETKGHATASPADKSGNAISQSQSHKKVIDKSITKKRESSVLSKDDLNALWRETVKTQSGLTLTASDAFNYICNAYPSAKCDKTCAGEVFLKKGFADMYEKIVAGIEAWKPSRQWSSENGKYTPKLSNFLEKAQWELSPPVEQAQSTGFGSVDYDPAELEGASA